LNAGFIPIRFCPRFCPIYGGGGAAGGGILESKYGRRCS
uniref:Uncharacterized protein n=1 Tax=Brugia timori TaxID=42155 RepID=A0A0R3QR42_9BILA